MAKSEAVNLLEEVKNELKSIRSQNPQGKCPAFPPKLWHNLKILAKHYPNGQLQQELHISSSQISKAKRLDKKLISHKDMPQLVEVKNIAPCEDRRRGRVILECRTSTGLVVSVFE